MEGKTGGRGQGRGSGDSHYSCKTRPSNTYTRFQGSMGGRVHPGRSLEGPYTLTLRDIIFLGFQQRVGVERKASGSTDSDLYGGPQGAAPEPLRPPAHACPPTANWQGRPPGSSLALAPLPQGSISQAWQIPLPARTPSGHQLSQALIGKNSSRLAPQQLKPFSARPGTQKTLAWGAREGWAGADRADKVGREA